MEKLMEYGGITMRMDLSGVKENSDMVKGTDILWSTMITERRDYKASIKKEKELDGGLHGMN